MKSRVTEDTNMPDAIARKRLKKKMLDRWENEGGRIVVDSTGADATPPTSEIKGQGKKLSSPRNISTLGAPASPTKRRKTSRK